MKHDANELYNNAKDLEISKYTTLPYPYKLNHAEEFIIESNKKILKKENYELGIELLKTRTIIGMMSLIDLDYDNKNSEIGYWLGKKYWRKKLAKEAIKLILNYGFNELKLERIYARVMSPNISSAKLLESVGFIYEGRSRKASFRKGKWMDDLRYGLLREEFF